MSNCSLCFKIPISWTIQSSTLAILPECFFLVLVLVLKLDWALVLVLDLVLLLVYKPITHHYQLICAPSFSSNLHPPPPSPYSPHSKPILLFTLSLNPLATKPCQFTPIYYCPPCYWCSTSSANVFTTTPILCSNQHPPWFQPPLN